LDGACDLMIQNKLRYQFKKNETDIRAILSKRDFSLSQKERTDYLWDILYDEKGNLNEYLEFFCDLEYKPGQSIFNPSSKQPLSHDIEFCTGLEILANYILFSPDGERLTQKTQYNIYKDEKEFWEKTKSDYSLEYDDDVDIDSAIDYLVDKNHNYLCEKSQKIFARDLEKHPVLKEYKDTIDYFSQKIKTIPNDKSHMKERRTIGMLISGLRKEQCVLKTILDKTIYFKHIASSGEKLSEPDIDGFDYDAVEKMFRNANSKQLTPFGELGDVFLKLLEILPKTAEESLILAELEKEDKKSYADVARQLNMDVRFVQQCVAKIRNRVIKEYMRQYEDWYYTFEDFGWYKTCSVCGKVKLLSPTYFSKNTGSNDGFRANCKNCQ
jgi:hypothetical protein